MLLIPAPLPVLSALASSVKTGFQVGCTGRIGTGPGIHRFHGRHIFRGAATIDILARLCRRKKLDQILQTGRLLSHSRLSFRNILVFPGAVDSCSADFAL